MKRIVLLIAAVVLTATSLSAQIVPGMKYKDVKDMYNPRMYVKSVADPYSPAWAGIGSFFVPGLGQLVSGEAGRGIAIFGGNAAFGLAEFVFAHKYVGYIEKDANGNYVKDSDGTYLLTDKKAAMGWGGALLGTSLAHLAFEIWNICDAVKVARVKNMYYQDLQSLRSVEMGLYPSVDFARSGDGFQPVASMTIAVRF